MKHRLRLTVLHSSAKWCLRIPQLVSTQGSSGNSAEKLPTVLPSKSSGSPITMARRFSISPSFRIWWNSDTASVLSAKPITPATMLRWMIFVTSPIIHNFGHPYQTIVGKTVIHNSATSNWPSETVLSPSSLPVPKPSARISTKPHRNLPTLSWRQTWLFQRDKAISLLPSVGQRIPFTSCFPKA